MGCGTITKVQYVKPTVPPLPAKPDYYAVPFNENYCLDEGGAKNLLKNKTLIDDYTKQLEAIIEGLR